MRTFYPSARVNLALVPEGRELANLDDGDLLRLTDVRPRAVRVRSNNPHEADTFEVTLDESLFPIDPRLVQTLSADIYLGDAGGLDGRITTADFTDHLLLGTMDEIEKEYQRRGSDAVVISGRDYAAFLLDAEWFEHLSDVELGRPLSDVVREVLDAVPAARPMRVESAFEETNELPGGAGRRGRYVPKDGATVWEALSQLASRVGAIITVRGEYVVIRPPRSVMADAPMPVFVAGRNLENLKVRKKYGQSATPNIIVQAMHPDTFEVVEGRWPDSPSEKKRVTRSTGIPQSSDTVEWKRFTIRHPKPTESALATIAERIWERMAQQQIEVNFETREMRVWELPADRLTPDQLDITNTSFDVTQLRNGAAVRVLVDRESRDVLEKAITPDQKARQLQARGFRRRVARELAEGWEIINTPMFVREANHYLKEGGEYTCTVSAENRITV